MEITMQSWIGHYESELLSSWGMPHREYMTRDDKKILTWKQEDFAYRLYRLYSFTIDRKGVIVFWNYDVRPMDEY